MNYTVQLLLLCPLFDHVERKHIEEWCQEFPLSPVVYHQDEVIHFQGDAYEDLIVLLEGKANARFQDYSGKIMRVETLQAPEAVAAAILFSREAILPVMLIAESKVRLLRIPKKRLLSLFQREPVIMENYLRDMGDKVAFLADKIRLIQFSTLKQKLAGYLLFLRDSQKRDSLKLLYSREKLAEMFGVERPSLSRELSRMNDEGLLEVKGREILITDLESLKGLLEEG
ncbi:MAG: Crp/Fnr family transcriptional regulator [Spirochaetales bacterium]|nr:Crp/Fnr family transcriptional regulator [Spirochaetales bacterium]